MAEQFTLTAPIEVVGYLVSKLVLDWGNAKIGIQLVAPTGEILLASYQGDTATTLMLQLNKLDLSTNSLHKRILERLQTDGLLPEGSVTGSPD